MFSLLLIVYTYFLCIYYMCVNYLTMSKRLGRSSKPFKAWRSLFYSTKDVESDESLSDISVGDDDNDFQVLPEERGRLTGNN